LIDRFHFFPPAAALLILISEGLPTGI
jgi:hypothetical protein